MLACVAGVLKRSEVAEVLSLFERGRFVDGRSTAGGRAAKVKRNLQMDREDEAASPAKRIVKEALERSAEFRRAALPRRIASPLLSRYEPGMTYGSHVDNALMGGESYLRSDVATTVFLSDPDTYDGGELVIGTAFGDQEVKLMAGDAVVYPASSVHRVAPVENGVRLAAVTWAQSLVRDPARREILADLELIRDRLNVLAPGAAETDLAYKTHANLLRAWAEP